MHCLSKKNIEYDYEYKWNVFIVSVLVNRPRWTNRFGRMLGDKLERKTATHEKIKKNERGEKITFIVRCYGLILVIFYPGNVLHDIISTSPENQFK